MRRSSASPSSARAGADAATTRTSCSWRWSSGTTSIGTPRGRPAAASPSASPRVDTPSLIRTMRAAESGGTSARPRRMAAPRSVPSRPSSARCGAGGCATLAQRVFDRGFGGESQRADAVVVAHALLGDLQLLRDARRRRRGPDRCCGCDRWRRSPPGDRAFCRARCRSRRTRSRRRHAGEQRHAERPRRVRRRQEAAIAAGEPDEEQGHRQRQQRPR